MSNGDLMKNKINIIALAAGISTLLLIVISIFVPWWQLVVGNPSIATVNVSPVNLNLALLDNSLITVPLVLAINIAVALTLAAGSIIMLIYSLKPNKPYSMKLLGFGYKKPLYAVITFVIGLFVMSIAVQRFSGLTVPLLGSGVMSLPNNMVQGANISVDVSAAFGWPFYFAIVVAGLCIAARFYHKRVVADNISIPNTSITK